MSKYNWKFKQKNQVMVELDSTTKKECIYDTETKIISLPIITNNNTLEFECMALKFGEILLYNYLRTNNMQLKPEYYN